MQWLFDALTDIYNKLVATLGKWAASILDGFVWIVNGIVEYFWAVVDYCLEMAWGFGYYLYDLFLGENGFVWYPIYWAIWAGREFLAFFPSLRQTVLDNAETFEYMGCLTGQLDQFFPITESFQLGVTFAAFVAVFLVAKLLLKLIPSIG
jgi:hypothetical protein